MARGAHGMRGAEYGVAAAMLVLALLFPIGLMIFDPTLMFERGWEQYVGTGIYLWAVLTLGRELLGLWRNERAFEEAPDLLKRVNNAAARQAVATGAGAERAAVAVSDEERRHPAPPRPAARQLHPRDPQPVGHAAHGGQPRGLRAGSGAGGRAVHADAIHPLPAAGDRLHRHGRGDLAGLDEDQRGAADGQGARRVPVEPDGRDGGLADRLRQHAAGPVPERRA